MTTPEDLAEYHAKSMEPDYTAIYDNVVDSALNFALFGLDRELPKWLKPNWDYPVLDLGPGSKLIPGAVRLDWPKYDWEPKAELKGLGFEEDGNKVGVIRRVSELQSIGKLPYNDKSVGGIFCVNLLEHLWDPRPLIWEMARVLRPGCPINVFVPHADSIMYKQDLDHKTQFILDTWRNLLDPHPYYDKGHAPDHGLRRGAEFKFAIKEGNEACIAQLIKISKSS
jgi:SAM-dependent methyltransferase